MELMISDRDKIAEIIAEAMTDSWEAALDETLTEHQSQYYADKILALPIMKGCENIYHHEAQRDGLIKSACPICEGKRVVSITLKDLIEGEQ